MELNFYNKTRKDLTGYKEKYFNLFNRTKDILKLKKDFMMSVTIVSKRKFMN